MLVWYLTSNENGVIFQGTSVARAKQVIHQAIAARGKSVFQGQTFWLLDAEKHCFLSQVLVYSFTGLESIHYWHV